MPSAGCSADSGRLAAFTDVRGHTTTFAHAADRMTITRPDDSFTEVIFQAETGLVAAVNYSDRGRYTFDYDYDSRKKERYTMVKTPSGLVRETWSSPDNGYIRTAINGTVTEEKRFTASGRVVEITDESGRTTRKEYNEWGKETKVVYPDGSQTTTVYDNTLHQPLQKTDERGMVTRYAYDEAGLLIRRTEAADTSSERVTEYTYDDDGNLVETVQPGSPSRVTTMTYDEAGNLTSVTDPEGGCTRFTEHDAMGNVLTRIDPRGEQWTYTYDPAGHLTAVTDPLGQTTRYEYDARGNKTREIDPDNTETRYAYDRQGNLIRQTKVIDPADESQNQVTTYEYNFAGDLTQMTDPEGVVTTYAYDSRGRLVRTTDGAGNQTALAYAASGTDCSSCAGSSDQPARIDYPTFARTMWPLGTPFIFLHLRFCAPRLSCNRVTGIRADRFLCCGFFADMVFYGKHFFSNGTVVREDYIQAAGRDTGLIPGVAARPQGRIRPEIRLRFVDEQETLS